MNAIFRQLISYSDLENESSETTNAVSNDEDYNGPVTSDHLRSFMWAENTCPFDCVITIFVQYYFEYFHKRKFKQNVINNFGCLGKELLEKIRDINEEDFDPEAVKSPLQDIIYKKMRKICINQNFSIYMIFICNII